jgi:hypothetical protein
MFLPYFIAILLGWACPSDANMNCANSNGTVQTTDAPTPGGDPTTPTTPAPGDDTGGEHSHFPPKNP